MLWLQPFSLYTRALLLLLLCLSSRAKTRLRVLRHKKFKLPPAARAVAAVYDASAAHETGVDDGLHLVFATLCSDKNADLLAQVLWT